MMQHWGYGIQKERNMIVDRPGSHFIFIVPRNHVYNDYNYIRYDGKPLTNKEYLQYWGKWVFIGDPKKLRAFRGEAGHLLLNKKSFRRPNMTGKSSTPFNLANASCAFTAISDSGMKYGTFLNPSAFRTRCGYLKRRPWKGGCRAAICSKSGSRAEA